MSASFAKRPRLIVRLRIGLIYLWRHRRWPDIKNPQRFTEFVQHRKLFDRNARMPALTDKVAAKRHIASTLGQAWAVPTLWDGDLLPDTPPWPTPFVVKSRHGCNQIAFVRDKSTDWPEIQRLSKKWMQRTYGGWLDEWAYRGIPKGLLVEPYIGTGHRLPIDYKVYVFGGTAQFVQVHLGRGSQHRWILFDRNWQRISADTSDPDPAPPKSLTQILGAAEILGEGFDFVRADFYEVAGHPLFGELCFYPGSGLDPFHPVDNDLRLGSLWANARRTWQPRRNKA